MGLKREQIRLVLAGTKALEFRRAKDDEGRYAWIEQLLRRRATEASCQAARIAKCLLERSEPLCPAVLVPCETVGQNRQILACQASSHGIELAGIEASPVTQWLWGLARLAHGECGGPGVVTAGSTPRKVAGANPSRYRTMKTVA